MSKVTRAMARPIEAYDRLIDRLPIIKAKICLDIASRVLAINERLFRKMVEYAKVVIEEERTR